MGKRTIPILILVILVLTLGVLFLSGKVNFQGLNLPIPGQQGNNDSTDPAGETPPIDPLIERIEDMTLEEKVGQLVMVGVDGYEVNANTVKFIQNYQVSGFVLLKKNIRDSQQMLKLVNRLKEENAANKFPLFLALDQEGGRISRMPEEFEKTPSSQRVGAQGDEDLGKRMGEILGQEVKQFGMNVNFAPVLDIFSNPHNTVIGDRAFGSNPELVSKVGIQTMQGIQEQGIIAVVKHFPGHGDTLVDSHVGLPKVDYDLERLRNFELIPFAQAMSKGVDAIMLAHILVPKIDPDYPASFSKTLIGDVLRKEMKFDGVVITDDMTMGAIVENYDISEAAVKSILAGSDIILVCHDVAKEEAVLNGLLNAARTGKIPVDRIDESVYRVLKLKEKYGLADRQTGSLDIQGMNAKIEQLYKDYPGLKD